MEEISDQPNLKARISRQFSRPDHDFAHSIKHLLESDDKIANKTPDHEPPCNGNIDFKIIDMPEFSGSNASIANAADAKKMLWTKKSGQSIMSKLPEDSEGALVLVGTLDIIEEPLTAFVRLAEGTIMPDGLEIPIPVRFIFLLLTPKSSKISIDCHEVGRSFSTLMSNVPFQNVCYRAEERRELLNAINDFLDESVVLPPGDWDSKNLLSMSEIDELRRKRQEVKLSKQSAKEKTEKIVATTTTTKSGLFCLLPKHTDALSLLTRFHAGCRQNNPLSNS